MSYSQGVVKRGYLFDRKGLLDRKRWYVLRHDLTRRSCLLEIYRDEKAASKPDPPKAFINVHDVVEVHRITERKQSFEVLCPGLGYKFMANSDVEADEWVQALRKLILYRREPPLVPPVPPRPPGATTYLPTSSSSHRLTQPVAIIPYPSPSSSAIFNHPTSQPEPLALQTTHSTCSMSGSLSTPPDPASSLLQPPSLSPQQPEVLSMVRQRSAEFAPLPSPPSTSSDSSSMCSSSNASFEQSTCEADGESKCSHFRVHLKESEGVLSSGPVDLVLGDDCISLRAIDSGNELVSWPISTLRRYGVNSLSFTIITGRNSSTGEGRFQFYTHQSRLLYSRVHAMAVHKATAKTQSLRRSGSECSSSEKASHLGSSPPALLHGQAERELQTSCMVEDCLQFSGLEHSRLHSHTSTTLPARPYKGMDYPRTVQYLCAQCSVSQSNWPGQSSMTGLCGQSSVTGLSSQSSMTGLCSGQSSMTGLCGQSSVTGLSSQSSMTGLSSGQSSMTGLSGQTRTLPFMKSNSAGTSNRSHPPSSPRSKSGSVTTSTLC